LSGRRPNPISEGRRKVKLKGREKEKKSSQAEEENRILIPYCKVLRREKKKGTPPCYRL